jgi:RNA polymerase sigma factor (sigma-70 family)
MSNRLWQTAVERVGVLTAPFAFDEMGDAELLRRFVAMREECAFAALVRRHGSLVWAVCRSLMHSEADAEDAFQATFLVLVRSAGKVKKPNALGAWLHTVAGRVCRNGLRSLARRKKYERAAAITEADRPIDGAMWDRWQAIAHEEIDRLPESLRVAFVLCVMQGVRQQDAADRLGWKLGTVSGRVCKAKQLLSEALNRRGLVGPAVLAAALGAAASPLAAGLANKGTAVAIRLSEVSTTINQLAHGAMGGIMTKTKLLTVILLAGGLAIGVGSQVIPTADAQVPGKGAGAVSKAGPSFPVAPPEPGTTPPPGFQGPGGAPPGVGSPGFPGGPGAGGAPGMPGMPGMGGGGVSGFGGGFMATPHIEYEFVAKAKSTDAFKKLLTQRGNEGWEYVGVIPDGDELIFKRTHGMSGARGMAGGMGMGGMGGVPPGMTGPGGGSFGRSGGSSPGGPGSGFPAGGAGAARGQQGTIELQVDQTIRYQMASGNVVRSVFFQNNKVASVALDPTDSKSLIIRGLSSGETKLELEDTAGNKEAHTIRVK